MTASAERGERLAALGAAAVVHDIGASAGPFDLALESTGGANLVRDGKITAVREYTDTQHAAHVLFGQPLTPVPHALTHRRRLCGTPRPRSAPLDAAS